MRLFAFFVLSVASAMPAQLLVKLNDSAPVTITAADLAALPQHHASLQIHGQTHTYDGPLLHDVLAKAGVQFGKELHGAQLSTYVCAIAHDGYEVVYALAELDPTVEDSEILVADKENGGALLEEEGPLRLVVPHDKRPTRSIRMVTEIDVVQLKK